MILSYVLIYEFKHVSTNSKVIQDYSLCGFCWGCHRLYLYQTSTVFERWSLSLIQNVLSFS